MVTYTVVVEAPNIQLKLLPGMTATLAFQIEKHQRVMTIPNAALRFHPKPDQVRPADQAIVEGMADEAESNGADGATFSEMGTAAKHELSHRGRAFRALADALAALTNP